MMNWINKRRNKKGFTLVELVVVIAILGILSAIAVPKLTSSRANAAIAAHNANVRTLESSATLAVSEGSGAITWNGEDEDGDKKDTTDGKGKGWGHYLQSWPDVPKGIENEKDVNGDEIGTSKYKVVITANGEITVTPGKID